ncbi:MAG: DNA repair protein RecO [Bacteroidia bacterium]|jgi:DNA repair protein RecO (recombination protein O)|nr:DNA repair protein RecO [Bacteroidia bacterium]
MIEKTRGIVLHQIKYTDSGIVAWLYTRKFGRQSFMVKGIRNRKSGKHNVFFQPLFILDMVVYFKESRGMQTLKEFSVSYAPSDIYFNIKKSSVAIFLGEVLASVLKEEAPNEELFDFIERSVVYFDRSTEGYANFHIAFLAGLVSYLGFEPSPRSSGAGRYFDMLNGVFVSLPPDHGNYANEEISEILAAFFASSYENINRIVLTGSLRNEVLDSLVKYYSLHLPGLKKIMSLEVLKEVFG